MSEAEHSSVVAPKSDSFAAAERDSATASLPEGFSCLYEEARAAEIGLTSEEFLGILRDIGAKYLPKQKIKEGQSEASDPFVSAEAFTFYSALHLQELALARACAKGSERAWELFLERYRAKLYEAALSIAKEDSAARELADSLYADLLGLGRPEKPTASKLQSYSGRGSLEGWMRAVLAQEYVNRYRSRCRLVSLEEQVESGVQFGAREQWGAGPGSPDPRLEVATGKVLQALPGEDRYILASYYLDGRTLAEIAGVLGVHESTISRRVEKIVKGLRKQIVGELRARGMTRDQAKEALEIDVRDLSVNVRTRLAEQQAQEKGSGAVP